MFSSVNPPPSIEATLDAKISDRGVELVEHTLGLAEHASDKVLPPEHTWEEFERDWKAFCEPIQGLPQDVDLSREAIYAEHD